PGAEWRKTRKGTQSCWECRRRKVRCIFASSAHACNNCRRRGSTCIGQEYPDKAVPSVSNNQVEGRLSRVENLLEQLLANTESIHALQSPTRDRSGARSTSVTLENREESRPKLVSSTSHRAHNVEDGITTRSRPPSKPASVPDRRAPSKYEELARDLIAAWPSEDDIDIICSLPMGISTSMFCGICTSCSTFTGPALSSPREMLQPPRPGNHPVLIARKLLVLGVFLQGIPPSSIRDLGYLGTSIRSIMPRVVDRAISLVTTNEDLIGSVEGIECIMLEAMYQNYAGNLHRAWMAIRRAITVAQMMALHRGRDSPSLKILDPETQVAFDPVKTHFRLAQMDRYLSIMLGLPHTSLEDLFSTPQVLEELDPNERMQRIHCAVAGHILHRKDGDVNSLVKIHEDDMLLHKAAAEMPPQWWLIPNFMPSNGEGANLLRDTNRIMDQLTHYHLFMRLHLPYMLCSSCDHRYDRSRITVINASREILSRYIALRTSNPGHFYCRGCDFLAFMAITILCIAHINSQSQFQGFGERSCPVTGFESLVHSRPSDRGYMERTLQIIESMSCNDVDLIAYKLTRIIHHLLTIEANAAKGDMYQTSSSKDSEGGLEYDGRLTNNGKALHIQIPYFGTINFERGVISKPAPKMLAQPELGIPAMLVTDRLPPGQPVEQAQHPSSGSDILSTMSYTGSQIMPSDTPQLLSALQPESPNGSIILDSNDSLYTQLPASMGFPGADEVELQGVDFFFDSLFCGAEITRDT
ncbi:hypothetical protein N7474_010899, partial [Penicillium riverlandense]|uniref:uncharacterized protein n=1 Tax=Penicillium riverlandense TaxID=1903569 RepID=UPI002546799D